MTLHEHECPICGCTWEDTEPVATYCPSEDTHNQFSGDDIYGDD